MDVSLATRIGYTADAILRFRDEQHGTWHPGRLLWPGLDGIPVLLGEGETVEPVLEPERLYMYLEFHARLFSLDSEEDMTYYCWVNDRIVGGWFLLVDKRFLESKHQVHLEWVQRYLKVRPNNHRALRLPTAGDASRLTRAVMQPGVF